MNPSFLFATSCTLLLASCQMPAATTAPAESTTAAADTIYSYLCASGRRLTVSYPSDTTARLHYEARVHELQLAISASGARYTGDALEWWSKGNEGTLSSLEVENSAGTIIERCRQAP